MEIVDETQIPDFLDRITQNVYNKSHKNSIWFVCALT